MRGRIGRLVVVGGHSRGVGKTAMIEHVLRSRPDGPWVAVKISAHRHAPDGTAPPVLEEACEPAPTAQTGRYLAAGAARAWLCRCQNQRLADAAAFVDGLLDQGRNVIVESNRIVRFIRPDELLFVVSDRIDDWKASSAWALPRADAIVLAPGSSRVPPRAVAVGGSRVAGLPVFAFTEWSTIRGLGRWLDQRVAGLPRGNSGRTASTGNASSR